MTEKTNREIDDWVETHIQTSKAEFPQDRIANLEIGFALLRAFKKELPRTDENAWEQVSDLHNAQELANRSCQRLRKEGKVTYDSKKKWTLTNIGQQSIDVYTND